MSAHAPDPATADRNDQAGVSFRPLAGSLGAEVEGVDLARPIDDATFAAIETAFTEHCVLVFPGRGPLSSRHLIDLASRFGEPDDQPFAGPFRLPTVDDPHVFAFAKEADDRAINLGGFWHADVTYRERPHQAGLLYAKEAPAAGGDTQFANLYLAYEALSPGLKRKLDEMRAVHSSTMDYGGTEARFAAVGRGHAPRPEDRRFSNITYQRSDDLAVEETLHPVVRVHPRSGRRHLYVNRGFTTRFEGMSVAESRPLLEFLFEHACRPEFTCRVRWSRDAVVLWDNRCTHHYAINDYFGERRVMHRVAVHEDVA